MTNARWRMLANKTIREVEAERDAALATIELVRAVHQIVEIEPSSTICRECSFQLPNGAFFGKVTEWPCPTVAALDGAPEPDNDDPCDAEVYSWDYYRPEQIDSYWIRCTLLGKHDEHEDSHTGLKWRSGLPVEGESK